MISLPNGKWLVPKPDGDFSYVEVVDGEVVINDDDKIVRDVMRNWASRYNKDRDAYRVIAPKYGDIHPHKLNEYELLSAIQGLNVEVHPYWPGRFGQDELGDAYVFIDISPDDSGDYHWVEVKVNPVPSDGLVGGPVGVERFRRQVRDLLDKARTPKEERTHAEA